MKPPIMLLFVAFLANVSAQSQSIFDDFDAFFKLYVKEGRVDYERVAKNLDPLKTIVNRIGQHDLENNSKDQRVAFSINAYNLLTIYQIAQHYPRIKKPTDVEGFFKTRKFNFAGKELTLDEIEFNEIFQNRSDPRIHFALVCGARGCPFLDNKAIRPKSMDTQLERRTKIIINYGDFIEVSGKQVRLSQIFEWYKKDFEKEGSIVDFINKYRERPIASTSIITYRPYDWRINNSDTKN